MRRYKYPTINTDTYTLNEDKDGNDGREGDGREGNERRRGLGWMMNEDGKEDERIGRSEEWIIERIEY